VRVPLVYGRVIVPPPGAGQVSNYPSGTYYLIITPPPLTPVPREEGYKFFTICREYKIYVEKKVGCFTAYILMSCDTIQALVSIISSEMNDCTFW